MQEYCSNLTVKDQDFTFYDIEKVATKQGVTVEKLPYTIRILFESLLRKKDGVDAVSYTHLTLPTKRIV